MKQHKKWKNLQVQSLKSLSIHPWASVLKQINSLYWLSLRMQFEVKSLEFSSCCGDIFIKNKVNPIGLHFLRWIWEHKFWSENETFVKMSEEFCCLFVFEWGKYSRNCMAVVTECLLCENNANVSDSDSLVNNRCRLCIGYHEGNWLSSWSRGLVTMKVTNHKKL